MTDDWLKIFDEFSTKVVSKTDKVKGAYVVNAEQKTVISGALLDQKMGTYRSLIIIHFVREPDAHRKRGWDVKLLGGLRLVTFSQSVG
jgi:hypothetical protein